MFDELPLNMRGESDPVGPIDVLCVTPTLPTSDSDVVEDPPTATTEFEFKNTASQQRLSRACAQHNPCRFHNTPPHTHSARGLSSLPGQALQWIAADGCSTSTQHRGNLLPAHFHLMG